MIDDPGCKVCQHYIMGLSLFIVTRNWDQKTQRGEIGTKPMLGQRVSVCTTETD